MKLKALAFAAAFAFIGTAIASAPASAGTTTISTSQSTTHTVGVLKDTSIDQSKGDILSITASGGVDLSGKCNSACQAAGGVVNLTVEKSSFSNYDKQTFTGKQWSDNIVCGFTIYNGP